MNEEFTLGIISDPHANLLALETVLEDMASKYPITKIINVGDIVGYYTQPREVMELCFETCDKIVKGNHDDAAGRSFLAPDFNRFAGAVLNYTIAELTTDEKRKLYNLPAMETFQIEKTNGKVTIQLVHGSPEYPLDFYMFNGTDGPTSDQLHLVEYMELCNLDIICMGHTHKPYIRRIGSKLLCNPGSTGQPRDGIPEPSYILLDPIYMQGVIERVKYDIEVPIKLLQEAGLPYQLGERLRTGK